MQVLQKINRPQIGLFFCKNSFKKILVNDLIPPYPLKFWWKILFEKLENLVTILSICGSCALISRQVRGIHKPPVNVFVSGVLTGRISADFWSSNNLSGIRLQTALNDYLRICRCSQ